MNRGERVNLGYKIVQLEKASDSVDALYGLLSRKGYKTTESDFHIPVLETLDLLKNSIEAGLDRAYAERARDDRCKAAL